MTKRVTERERDRERADSVREKERVRQTDNARGKETESQRNWEKQIDYYR